MDTKEERNSRDSWREDHSALVLWNASQKEALRSLGFEGDLIVEGPRGNPQLNPLYLARIAERISFDGDFPVLRSGPLPEGGSPAVPVITSARDPVVIGGQLQAASKEVGVALQAAQEELQSNIFEGISEEEAVARSSAIPGAFVPGYGPGTVPSPRSMTSVVPRDLPWRDRQRLAWSVMATTQGRESLGMLLERQLSHELSCEISQKEGVPITAHWTQSLDDVGQVNPRFSIVDTILGSLRRQLRGHVYACLRVQPIHTVHLRRVGFVCEAYPC